jgi:hypothetical protein
VRAEEGESERFSKDLLEYLVLLHSHLSFFMQINAHPRESMHTVWEGPLHVETKEGKKLQQNEEIMMKRTKKVSNWFIDSNGAKFSTFVSKKVVN